MECIIGRDGATSKLCVNISGKSLLIGASGSVPQTVSRQHCRLTIDDDSGKITIKNLKPQNITYVDGIAAESKAISESDQVDLGVDRYKLPLAEVLAEMRKAMPKVADIRPLKKVWDDYEAETNRLAVAERRFNAMRGVTGLVTMVAIVCAMTLGHNPLYYILYGVAIVLTVAFTVKSYIDATKIPEKRKKLNEDLRHKYVCPNCGKYFSGMTYDDLAYYDECPWCKAKFKK